MGTGGRTPQDSKARGGGHQLFSQRLVALIAVALATVGIVMALAHSGEKTTPSEMGAPGNETPVTSPPRRPVSGTENSSTKGQSQDTNPASEHFHPVPSQITEQALDTIPEGTLGAVIIDLTTGETLLSLNAEETFIPASTYKLFVAYTVLNAIDQGETSLAENLVGESNEDCLDSMITYSANECAEAWLWHFGFDRVEAEAQALGATHTSFTGSDLETTPADLALFLEGLYRGEFLSDDSRGYLLDLMEHQERREGIPTGLDEASHPELIIADKIGDLDGMSRDAALIYTPEDNLVMVLMLDGYGFENLAEIAGILYQGISD